MYRESTKTGCPNKQCVEPCRVEALDDKLDTSNHLFLQVLDQHAPLNTVRLTKTPSPWVSRSVHKEIGQ